MSVQMIDYLRRRTASVEEMNLVEQLRTWDEIPDDDDDAFHWLDLKTAEAVDLIERQAAQIEMMREVQIDAGRYRWLRNALSDRSENGVSHHFCSIRISEELDIEIDKASKKKPCEWIVVQPDQALEQFAAKVKEQCAQVCESMSGSDYSPKQCASAIRAIKELP